MKQKIDFNHYSTVVFIDSMVVLEGNLLDQQRWSDIDETGPVLVLVVPQVSREIDKRKRDGRLAIYARAFNRLMEPTALSGQPELIVQRSPRVDICLATPLKISWDEFDELDPEDADAKVVIQVLKSSEGIGEKSVFLSQDIYPISIASRYGIKTRKLPDNWIREPEPSPHQKEVQKLKAKVKILETSQPEIKMSLRYCPNDILNIIKISNFPSAEKQLINAQILRNNPPAAPTSSMLMSSFMDDHSYMDRYKEFKEVTVPCFVADLPANLQKVYNQFPISLSLQNTGNVQAEKLIVRIEVKNALAHKKWTVMGTQPSAPKPRDPYDSIIKPYDFHRINDMAYSVGRHELDIEFDRDVISIECEDFRHGTNENIEFILTPDIEEQPVVISVRATASNLKGEVIEEFIFQKEIEIAKVEDLIDFKNTSFCKARPMEQEIEEAIDSEDFDQFYFITYKVDEG